MAHVVALHRSANAAGCVSTNTKPNNFDKLSRTQSNHDNRRQCERGAARTRVVVEVALDLLERLALGLGQREQEHHRRDGQRACAREGRKCPNMTHDTCKDGPTESERNAPKMMKR